MNSTLELILNALKDIKSTNQEFKTNQELQTAEFRKMFIGIQKENKELKKWFKTWLKKMSN